MATRQMDIQWLIEFKNLFDVFRDLDRMPFGIGRSELASRVSSAGDQPRANRMWLPVQPCGPQFLLDSLDIGFVDSRDQNVLPAR